MKLSSELNIPKELLRNLAKELEEEVDPGEKIA